MSLCEYVVVRYVQDEIRNEPVNIGIILRDSNSGSIFTKFYKSMNQLLIRKPDANVDLIYDYIESIQAIKSSDEEFLKDIAENFSHQIQFSEVMELQEFKFPNNLNFRHFFDTYEPFVYYFHLILRL